MKVFYSSCGHANAMSAVNPTIHCASVKLIFHRNELKNGHSTPTVVKTHC